MCGLRSAGLAIFVLAVAGCDGPAPVTQADTQQLSLAVQVDGGLLVREVFAVSGGAPAGLIERHATLPRADRVSAVAATSSSDRAAVTEAGLGRSRAPWLTARWPALQPGEAGRVLTLSYRVEGAVERIGPRGMVRWSVVPTPRIRARAVRIEVDLPQGAVWLAEPVVQPGSWAIERLPHRMTAESVGPVEAAGAELAFDFSIDGLGNPEPDWQFRAERARQLAPSWIAAGLFLLVTTIGIRWMLRVQYSKTAAGADDRRAVGRGLAIGGWTTVAFGAVVAMALPWVLPGFGDWPQALPAGFVASGLLLVAAARRFR